MSTEIVGKIVKGPSGRHLGRVTEAQGTRFCVEVEGEFSWLPRDVIFSVEEEQVTVIFEPSALGRYVLPKRDGVEKTG